MAPTQVYLLFDERMALHRPAFNPENPEYLPFENSNRIFKVYGRLLELERRLIAHSTSINDVMPSCERRFVEFMCRPVEQETVELVHSREHYDWLYCTSLMGEEDLWGLTNPDDLFVCRSTFLAASLACGGVVQCVNAVTSEETFSAGNRITRAIALVRPPGHHAEFSRPMGELTELVAVVLLTLVLFLQSCLTVIQSRILFLQ